MVLEAGRHLYDNYLTEDMRDEIRGIAEGAELPLDDMIILNTFLDTMMAFRAVVLFIVQIQSPYVHELSFDGSIARDSLDNDGDGVTDEDGEECIADYGSGSDAVLVEVPPEGAVRITLQDRTFGGLTCPDPRNVDPIGDMAVSADCVLADCIRDQCLGLDMVTRECFTDDALQCFYPRVAVHCLVGECREAADPNCVDPDSVRVIYEGRAYTNADPEVSARLLPEIVETQEDLYGARVEECQGPLEISFRLAEGFPAASLVSLELQAGDASPIYSPEPFHARYMRDERITFSTSGYTASTGEGTRPQELPNRGAFDGRTQPTASGFAVRGSATPDGATRLAHHFSLLDTDMVHEHTALFVHVPDDGLAYATVGWTGIIWGTSGMNEAGLSVAFNPSDSLDSSLVAGMLEDILQPESLLYLMNNQNLEGLAHVLAERQLLTAGMPAGFAGNLMLNQAETVSEALEVLHGQRATYGWNYLLADANDNIAVAEVDFASQSPGDSTEGSAEDCDGFLSYTPDMTTQGNLDDVGRPWASTGPDDIRIASQFQKNYEDMAPLSFMGIFSPIPQRVWTGFYYRSVRTFFALGEAIEARLGHIDTPTAIEIMRTPELVDDRDSMNAVVYEPKSRTIHYALGGVPATSLDFVPLDLEAVLAREVTP